jgi:hypothetical protein
MIPGRTLMPGLTIDLPEIEAQRILALGSAVALDAPKPTTQRKRKVSQADDAAA